MSALLILGLALILIFSFSLSTYIICYKIRIQDLLARVTSITILGSVISAVTFTISLILIWPPVM